MYGKQKNLIIICLLFLCFCPELAAPVRQSYTIIENAPVNPYKKLVAAIGMVETQCDPLAYNPTEGAAGILQIRPVRLVEYNRRTGSSYTRKDLFDRQVSEKIFLYFAESIGPYNIELIARRWNGSGALTDNYWRKVRKYL